MLKIFNHLKINYQIRVLKVRTGLEGVQPRTANEQILESNHNLVRLRHQVPQVEQIQSIILE